MHIAKMVDIASPTKVVRPDHGTVKSVAENTQILDTWFNIHTAKKAASANRFKFFQQKQEIDHV